MNVEWGEGVGISRLRATPGHGIDRSILIRYGMLFKSR